MNTTLEAAAVTAGAQATLSRRSFIKAGAALLAAGLSGRVLATTVRAERALTFYHTHTGEQLRAVYWAEGAYQTEELRAIYTLLRDFRSGEVSTIDVRLLDVLYRLSTELNADQPFHVISGYRSPSTNAMLRKTGDGVAKRSLHMQGLAVDVRLPGRELPDLRNAALALGGGGVGYYPDSDFVHIDVGRVRSW